MSPDWTRVGLLLGYAVISMSGMVLLKSAGSLVSVRGAVGFALYFASFALWTGIILRIMPLSQAFPLATGVLLIGSQLAGWLLFKEQVGLAQALGTVLILAGVILVSTTAQARI